MNTLSSVASVRFVVSLIVFVFLLIFATASTQAQNVAEIENETQPESATAKDAAGEQADSGFNEPACLRVSESSDGKPKALQTAIIRYVGKPDSRYAGQVVDLVGVVHIGEEEYYAELNSRLSKYDIVLYELVAPDGTRIRPEDLEKRRGLLASMQTGMKEMLGLEYQLEKIDYLAENFRHADMSPEEFAADLNRRGDSLWKMGARMVGAGLASQATSGGEAGLLLAFFSNDRNRQMKRVMAKQMVDIDVVTAGMDDENGENTIIKARNAKCFEILKEELDAGKKRLAVFYGAGHLPDMAERLVKEFEMKEKKTSWLDGWNLTRN